MSEELRPCPFCGGKAQLRLEKDFKMHQAYKICCLSCPARMEALFHSQWEAISAWNRRAGDE